MATSAASPRPGGTQKGSSPLWTMLGLAVVHLVAARRQKAAAGPVSALQRSSRGADARHARTSGAQQEGAEARDAKSHVEPEAAGQAETEKDRGRAASSP